MPPGPPSGALARDLVVLSHLRWTWVWQRPQHLVSRLAQRRRTWFVEEPRGADVRSPRLASARDGDIVRVWLEVPGDPERHLGFDAPAAACYAELLADLVGDPSTERTAWIWTPLALDLARATQPDVLVYDVMDDLASFKDASPQLVLAQQRALRTADVVFTGGRSLHRSVERHRRSGVHCFPSGVEPDHFARARPARRLRPSARPVAGYVGVIDERLDLDLVAGLAAALPEWEVRMVGPVAKIDPESLPAAPNLTWSGPRAYAELPGVMAGFDVALMPFALNEATRSISPTKTLEYLAAGLPVVSTRVPDVVADLSAGVDLQDDAAGFADACVRLRGREPVRDDLVVRRLLQERTWDRTAARMEAFVDAAVAASRGAERVAAGETPS